MKRLAGRDWLVKYSPEQGDLVTRFYVPALECAVRYDRSTGFFSAYARLYPRRSAHFSPLGRVVADFLGDKSFQNVAMHVKY